MELKTKTIGLRVPESLWEKLETLAAAQDIPASQLVRKAIKEFLEKVRLGGEI